ncbi:MAG: hypothetical protein JJU27_04675 [Gammaproteobacteria bacterium]|nr:hypothetical protein [Gammaproteobacteria bacterium]
MPTDSRSAFLMVHSVADLACANEALMACRSILPHRSPASSIATLQGIWLDATGVANPPHALVLPDAAGAPRTVRILEATGINGIWILCRLEATQSPVSRGDLVAALLACFGHQHAATLAARFIPIFAEGAPELAMRSEQQVLAARYPRLVLPPIHQDARGSLVLPAQAVIWNRAEAGETYLERGVRHVH